MPSRKRSSQDSGAGPKKRPKKAASHTATSTVATNDEAVISLSENTRNRQARRPAGSPTVHIPEDESLSLQTQQIVKSLTDKLESIVDRKIQQVLGASSKDSLPQSQTQPMAIPQQPNEAGVTREPVQDQAEIQDAHRMTEDSAVQAASAFLQAQSNSNKPTSSTRGVLQGFETLLNASLAPSTLDTYRRAWKLFHDFSMAYSNGSILLPVSTSVLALFVAFLHERAMSPKSITTYLSGISYVHKLSNSPDPTRHFLIASLLKGAQRLSASYDLRLPITVELLDKLVAALRQVCQSNYHEKLFSAMFLFAFNAFSRCSEITSCKPSTKQFILQLADISFKTGAAEPVTVTVTYRFFKHNNGKPHTISFSHGHTNVSPVRALEDYILIRGRQAGPLFTLTSGLPVPRRMFDKQLASALKFCGIDSKRYKSHSFRIGKATDCAQRGFSDAKIRLLGRWNSNAFQKYIRNTDF